MTTQNAESGPPCPDRRVAVVGAGFSGLAAARVLRRLGMDVAVYDRRPDVGGVWSSTRRYPGIRTQNDKGTYCFSDLPMPREYPEWPDGNQVQAYLQSYVAEHDLAPVLNLGTEVLRARLEADEERWLLDLRGAGGASFQERFDHLVVANGIFDEPHVPDLAGRGAFEAAGGRVVAAAALHDAEQARGRRVVVIGYGKTACDVAVPISAVAETTRVVARHLLWKMPARIAGVLNYKHLMLTRLGEALFRYIDVSGVERLLHGPGDGWRRRVVAGLQAVISRQLHLRESGLVPPGTFADIARSTVSLVTSGFYESVRSGRITVHRDTEVIRLVVEEGVPHAELSDDMLVPADLVVCGTGYRQVVPFFDDGLRARLQDERGNFRLHRHIHPLDVPHLSFIGYNSSLFSPLSAEMAAIWVGDHLTSGREIPVGEAAERIDARLAWMEQRTAGHHARGTNVIPFSMHNIDELLDEVDLNITRRRRLLQWFRPVDPAAYRTVLTRLEGRQRHRDHAAAAS